MVPLKGEIVALLAEGVDRNCQLSSTYSERFVALLAEGVDRNFSVSVVFSDRMVALLAEGVDRNNISLKFSAEDRESPSSRRAWIEI